MGIAIQKQYGLAKIGRVQPLADRTWICIRSRKRQVAFVDRGSPQAVFLRYRDAHVALYEVPAGYLVADCSAAALIELADKIMAASWRR